MSVVITGIAGDLLDKIGASGYIVTDKRLYPGTSKRQYKNKATLKFLRSELLYDAGNIAYVEGDVMPTDNEHDRHQVQDIIEDGNVDRVTRVLDLAIAHCREMLYPYTRTNIDTEEERDDKLEAPEEYEIDMMLPEDYSKSTLTYLEKLIHEYLVYSVLTDWLSITDIKNPNAAAMWEAKKEKLSGEIDSTIHARIHRVRRTQAPF